MSKKDRQKTAARTAKAEGAFCPSCGIATQPNARFCHGCGAALAGGTAAGGGPRWGYRLAVAGGVVALFGLTVFATMKFAEPDREAPATTAMPGPVFDAPAGAPLSSAPGSPPDLSQMTPRQAADRLFNRIMMATEQKNRDEVLRFAPMAIQAYSMLPDLDRDAHYHLGLIHSVTGDAAGVAREIAALRQGAPNHLLALVLEHDAAERAGDRATVARVLAAFPAAFAAEINAGRPEYEAHRNVIDRLRATATGGSTSAAPAPAPAAPAPAAMPAAPLSAPAPVPSAALAQDGAALFAARCAVCHGPAGTGTDKGPPLVHKIYEPSHHNDLSFYRAVREGVRAHHWKFGDMAPVPGVSVAETARIIAYVRRLQQAVGIR